MIIIKLAELSRDFPTQLTTTAFDYIHTRAVVAQEIYLNKIS